MLAHQAKAVFGCEFSQAYGMTESSGAVTYLGPADHAEGRNKLLSCGRPLKVVEKFRSSMRRMRHVPRAKWARGCHPRGPMVTKGYWNDEKATATTIVNGWLRTGDAAYFDEDGYLYIHDRVKEMIVSGGENVYPAEVENALFHHSDVADVAVIGVPDEKWGEAVKALVVLKPGASPSVAALIEHARAHIGGYKIPKSVEFVAHIPRNAAGENTAQGIARALLEKQGTQSQLSLSSSNNITGTNRMKALLCKEYGPPESLVLTDVPSPVAGAGQAVVSIRACGVNFPDVLLIENKYQYKPPLPFAPGGEVAGVVKSVGDGVSRFKAGDKVIARIGSGGMQEEVAVDIPALHRDAGWRGFRHGRRPRVDLRHCAICTEKSRQAQSG